MKGEGKDKVDTESVQVGLRMYIGQVLVLTVKFVVVRYLLLTGII